MVNGFKSGIIRLLRGVKQGDALSCALFLIIIDPMLRAVERSNKIKSLEITSPFTTKKVELKISGYADDLTQVVNSLTSLQNVFHLYHRFSKVSGLYLMPKKLRYFVFEGYNLPRIVSKLNMEIKPMTLFYHKESRSAGLVTQ
jgi:hypothetical protein